MKASAPVADGPLVLDDEDLNMGCQAIAMTSTIQRWVEVYGKKDPDLAIVNLLRNDSRVEAVRVALRNIRAKHGLPDGRESDERIVTILVNHMASSKSSVTKA